MLCQRRPGTMKFRFSLVVLALATAGSPALAQQDSRSSDETTTRLEQIVVSATRTEKAIKDVVGAVSVMDSEQIDAELTQNIRDLVRYEPGVQVNEVRGGFEGFNIRGVSGNRVKMVIDGVDFAQSLIPGSMDYIESPRGFVDVESLKSVEIIKGPASSLYGSDAMGGLVAFQTKDPEDLLKLTGKNNFASFKSGYVSVNEGFTETLSLANRAEKLETLLIYTRRDHKETDSYGGANILGDYRGQRDPSDTGLNNVLAKAQYQLTDTHRLGLTVEYFDAKTDIKRYSKYSETQSDRSKTSYGNDKLTRTRIGLKHEWDANNMLFDRLTWNIDWQDSKTVMETYMPAYSLGSMPVSEKDRIYDYRERGYILNAQLEKSVALMGMEHNLIYGFNYSGVQVTNNNRSTSKGVISDSSYIPEVDATKFGIFLQDDLQLTDRLAVVAGVRYDSFDYKPKTNTKTLDKYFPVDGSKWTGRLGTIYKLTENVSAFAQFSQGYKAPDLNDLYGNIPMDGAATILPNSSLKPEESNSYEIGVRGEASAGSYEVVGFYTDYKNFLEVREIPDRKDVFQTQNIGDTTIKGVEVKGELWLDSAFNAPEGTTLRGSLAWAEGKDNDKDQYLNSVAPLTATISLAYDAPAGNWGSALHWTLVKGKGDSKITNINAGDKYEKKQFNPAGYGIVDATAHYQPSDSLTLRAGLFNITDKKYWRLDDVRNQAEDDAGLNRYAQPGRNVAVSLNYVF